MRKLLLITALSLLALGTLSSCARNAESSMAGTIADNADEEVVLAEYDEELGYDPETDYLCAQAMMDQGYPLIVSFETFLNEYFKTDMKSSQQVDTAITAYRAVESSLRGIYEKNIDFSNEKTFEAASEEDYYCSFLRDEYINYAQLLLQKQVIASANSKTTFKVIDGLKDMNENLEELTMDFLGTFPNYFEKMDNALPCYARQCITK